MDDDDEEDEDEPELDEEESEPLDEPSLGPLDESPVDSPDDPPGESLPPAAALAAAFVAFALPRSFLAQPVPLNRMAGAAIALRSA